jgi:5-methylcytosine-specific restriction endonuclease McrA
MTTLREQILELHNNGKSYNAIANDLNCSKGTVSYHCNQSVKSKSSIRHATWKRKNVLAVKIHNFKFQSSRKRVLYGLSPSDGTVSARSLLKKIGPNPTCYLTGVPLDLNNPSQYSLDHIVPLAKGGQNTLSNCGIASKIANQAKGDLSYDKFVSLCKNVIMHSENGP